MDQSKPMKIVKLTFKREELLYDINTYGYVQGDVMPDETQHAKHQTQDIGQDGNVDMVTRLLDLYFTMMVDKYLYPYTKHAVQRFDPPAEDTKPKEPTPDATDNDVLKDTYIYTIRMQVPEDFSVTTVNYLEQLIHNFLVWRVLRDWLLITNPQAAQMWGAKADEALDAVKSALNQRIGKLLRPMSPWGQL